MDDFTLPFIWLVMNDSYARIKTEEAKRLAVRTVEVVTLLRTRELNARVLREANRHNWWTFLPGVKTWSLKQAREKLTRAGKYYSWLHYSSLNRAEAILNLVKAAGSDPYIYITAEDYEFIQFGSEHDRMGKAVA